MTANDLVRYAESKGWKFVRRGNRSSHLIFGHTDYRYHLAIPDHGHKQIKPGLLATLLRQIDGTWKGTHA